METIIFAKIDTSICNTYNIYIEQDEIFTNGFEVTVWDEQGDEFYRKSFNTLQDAQNYATKQMEKIIKKFKI